MPFEHLLLSIYRMWFNQGCIISTLDAGNVVFFAIDRQLSTKTHNFFGQSTADDISHKMERIES